MDELREKYLQGKMTKAEQAAFEKNLSTEEKEELATELGIREGLESGFRRELLDQVAGFEEKGQEVRRINPAYISVAASLFLVATLVLYFTRDQAPLFDQYYEVYPNYEVTTVRGEEDLSKREEAYLAYDAGNYQEAIDAFNQLDSLLAADYFFRGVSYIQAEEHQKALTDFQFVIKKNDEAYHDASIWYTALLHLKMEDEQKAIPLLESLSDGDSEFADTSNKLLAQL